MQKKRLNQLIFLDMIDYLVNETDGLPFETAFDGLYFIDRMISSSNFFVYNSFKQYLIIFFQFIETKEEFFF